MAIYVNGSKVLGRPKFNGTSLDEVKVGSTIVWRKFSQTFTLSHREYSSGVYRWRGTMLGVTGYGVEPSPNPMYIGNSAYYLWDFYTIYNNSINNADTYRLRLDLTALAGSTANDLTITSVTLSNGYQGGFKFLPVSQSNGYADEGGYMEFSNPIATEFYASGTYSFTISGYYHGD